jgi:hypothetical protein
MDKGIINPKTINPIADSFAARGLPSNMLHAIRFSGVAEIHR